MNSGHVEGTRVVLEPASKNREQFNLVHMDLGARPSEATVPGLRAQERSGAGKCGPGLPAETEGSVHLRRVRERFLGNVIQHQQQP